MLIVIGHASATPDTRQRVLDLAVAHCRRSREEPGCLLHQCHADLENPMRIVFTEYWADAAALRAHFGKPESAAFVKALRELSESTAMQIFEASERTPTEL
ncbi:putative quinol monooxygenase [Terricaulis sp.]|uniref:putative quinol monooxygenase n=1 Tax=Terricaulis sp. TaxID=2768686 RepID=UPI0037847B7F